MTGEHALELTDDSFDQQVLHADGLVLVDFYGEHCPPCKRLAPVIDEMARELSGEVKVCKMNAEKNLRVSIKYSLRAVPTVMIFNDGEPFCSVVGEKAKSFYVAEIRRAAG